ncbi:hypothetical protein HIM_03452 [Hirsutella minnesotensis 3608]|uniref:Cytidyltransferase-like domain-containing protein n=1 Tax=Hirsutella minnesotensis 3608 TaxID=1043627 RepID=A0A0F7ZMC0_9HYPO|nr:hypothetical protein HIM_03452 [Hirsutella minnesotensis 3608]
MAQTSPVYYLGDVVEEIAAAQGLPIDPSRRPFRSGSEQNGPMLRPDQDPYYVLLYPGSFNPPHRGHKAILNHVLNHTGVGFHFVAAFIVFANDEKLVHKYRREEKPMVLSKDKRATLWRESDIPRDRVWVFDGSERAWRGLRAQLQQTLQEARIDLSFVLLMGPDWMNSIAPTDPRDLGCFEAICSDISRPVDFRCPSTLRQLSGCSMWEPCETPSGTNAQDSAAEVGRGEVLGHRSTGKTANPVNRRLAQDGSPTHSGIRAAGMWSCSTFKGPSRYYYFLPAPLSGTERGEAPSSTEIRRAIAVHWDRLSEKDLDSALSPSTLMKYAIEGGPYSVPVVTPKFEGHEVRKAKGHELANW